MTRQYRWAGQIARVTWGRCTIALLGVALCAAFVWAVSRVTYRNYGGWKGAVAGFFTAAVNVPFGRPYCRPQWPHGGYLVPDDGCISDANQDAYRAAQAMITQNSFWLEDCPRWDPYYRRYDDVTGSP